MWWPWKGPGWDEGRLKKSRDDQQDAQVDADKYSHIYTNLDAPNSSINMMLTYQSLKTVHQKYWSHSPMSNACLTFSLRTTDVCWQPAMMLTNRLPATSRKYCNFHQVVHHEDDHTFISKQLHTSPSKCHNLECQCTFRTMSSNPHDRKQLRVRKQIRRHMEHNSASWSLTTKISPQTCIFKRYSYKKWRDVTNTQDTKTMICNLFQSSW